MEKRNILILWHWKRIRQRDQAKAPVGLSEGVPVTESPDLPVRRTMTILDEGDGVLQHIIDNILAIMTPELNDAQKPGKWLVFLHKDSFDHRKFPELKQQLLQKLQFKPEKDFDLIPFGGGDHFIYYKKLTDTGLLDQFGRFMHRTCRIVNQADDKLDFKSVLTNPETEKQPEKPEIRYEYFDQVWKYYTYRHKRSLYELQEQLLTRFVAEQPREAPSLLAYIKQTDLHLKDRLEEIFGWKEIPAARLDKIYASSTMNINAIYNELMDFIAKEPINSTNFRNYLIRLRGKFGRLLESMPESIY
jgi:hypothetical protein